MIQQRQKTITKTVNTKHHKLLHYVLIIFLMFAPLRSVFAMQFMAGDIEASSTNVASTFMTVASSTEHCQHMSDRTATNDSAVYQGAHTAKSCCNGEAPCKSNCHFAISASLFLQRADYSPALLNTDTFATISSTPLVRELSPPSRPPLPLHS